MYKAFRSAKVRDMKFSVERWKTCRLFSLWQACLLSGILLLSGTGFAQLSTASLSGAVRDSSGAVVPNAKIVLRNVATGVENTTTANGVGAYLFLDITLGNYTVEASATGFTVQKVPEFALSVGQAATIDFALTVGSQSTVVTVQGATPQLDASSATLGTVIGAQQVNDLPVPGRDFTQLLILTPGVSQSDNGQAASGYATPVPQGDQSVIPSINGQSNRSDFWFVDGLSDFGAFHSTYAVPPILDEMQDFKVASHADSAQYGSVTGGVVNVTTKSGTNSLHGSAWEYYRDAALEANNNYFSQTPKPTFTQNEFGGVIGGPVWLGKLYNGKNKTFFFGAYEGYRYSQGGSANRKIPTAAELAGDESSWPTQIFNPFTTTADTANPGHYIRQPYQGNQIPVGTAPGDISTAMVAWAKFVFPSNPVAAFDANGDNFVDTTPTTETINHWTARVDEKIGQNDSAFFRYSQDTAVTTGSDGLPGIPNTNQVPNRNWGGSYVHVFSPSLVLQVLAGRTIAGANAYSFWTNNSASTISTVGFAPQFAGSFTAIGDSRSLLPQLSIDGGYASPDEGVANHPNVPSSNQFSGVLTKTFGRHEMSAGGGFISLHFLAPIADNQDEFSAQQTADTNVNDPNVGINLGDPLASFLINDPAQALRRNENSETRFGGVMSEFLQDSWRVNPKLTVNAGLRYDLTLNPPYGTYKQLGQNGGPETGDIDFNNGNYVVQELPPACSVRGYAPCIPGNGTLPANVVVSPNRKLIHNTDTNVGPHLGFAYKVTDHTVVRGAFGIVFDNWGGVQQDAQNVGGDWPDTGFQQVSNLNLPSTSSPTPTVTAQDPFSGLGGSGVVLPPPTPFTSQGYMYDPNLKNAYAEQWNFGVQQLIGTSITMTANYVGMEDHRLDVAGLYNTALTPSATGAPFVGGVPNSRSLYPYIIPINYDRSVGSGNYHAFQFSLERRYSNGLSYGVSYTWSKSIDVGGDGWYGVEGGVPQDAYHPARYDRSVSGLNLPQNLTVNMIYQIPVGKGKRFSTGNGAFDYILGNWQINNLFNTTSGQPFTPMSSSDQANVGLYLNYEHLNVVPGVSSGLPHRSANKWFNTAAFAEPTYGTYGDAGRNSLSGPAYWNLSSSVFRLFPLGEGRQIEFRAEAYNLLNHVDLGNPNNTIESGTSFGTISGTASTARQLEIAGKFIF